MTRYADICLIFKGSSWGLTAALGRFADFSMDLARFLLAFYQRSPHWPIAASGRLPEKVKVANYALPIHELDRARADSVKDIGAKEAEVGLEARTRSS